MRSYKDLLSPVAPPPNQLAPGQSQELTEPRRAPSLQSDVGVPFVQALLTAIVVAFIPFTVGAIAIILLDGTGEHWKLTALVAALVFAASLAKAWFWRVAWVESTIDKLESLTGLDLPGNDDDGVHGFVKSGPNSSRAKNDAVALKRARLREFVEYAHGHATDTPSLRQAFSQSEINEFRNLLIQAGCATWKTQHHNQGWQFTHNLSESLDIVAKRIDFVERATYVE